jgi:hypothetical protein
MTEAKKDEQHILSVDEMLAADDVEYAVIPTWKVKNGKGELVQGYTRIASLSAEDVITWRETAEGPAKRSLGIRLFVNSLVDASGNRIGTPQHAKHVGVDVAVVRHPVELVVVEARQLDVADLRDLREGRRRRKGRAVDVRAVSAQWECHMRLAPV